ncbi:hypothetical protein K438DRAFT_1766292 [Mycena galopus ATCC 62051]|nr:hypothetical protein K438DRAFT_1766292 [Mycena galopus ATCC 62051]
MPLGASIRREPHSSRIDTGGHTRRRRNEGAKQLRFLHTTSLTELGEDVGSTGTWLGGLFHVKDVDLPHDSKVHNTGKTKGAREKLGRAQCRHGATRKLEKLVENTRGRHGEFSRQQCLEQRDARGKGRGPAPTASLSVLNVSSADRLHRNGVSKYPEGCKGVGSEGRKQPRSVGRGEGGEGSGAM